MALTPIEGSVRFSTNIETVERAVDQATRSIDRSLQGSQVAAQATQRVLEQSLQAQAAVLPKAQAQAEQITQQLAERIQRLSREASEGAISNLIPANLEGVANALGSLDTKPLEDLFDSLVATGQEVPDAVYQLENLAVETRNLTSSLKQSAGDASSALTGPLVGQTTEVFNEIASSINEAVNVYTGGFKALSDAVYSSASVMEGLTGVTGEQTSALGEFSGQLDAATGKAVSLSATMDELVTSLGTVSTVSPDKVVEFFDAIQASADGLSVTPALDQVTARMQKVVSEAAGAGQAIQTTTEAAATASDSVVSQHQEKLINAALSTAQQMATASKAAFDPLPQAFISAYSTLNRQAESIPSFLASTVESVDKLQGVLDSLDLTVLDTIAGSFEDGVAPDQTIEDLRAIREQILGLVDDYQSILALGENDVELFKIKGIEDILSKLRQATAEGVIAYSAGLRDLAQQSGIAEAALDQMGDRTVRVSQEWEAVKQQLADGSLSIAAAVTQIKGMNLAWSELPVDKVRLLVERMVELNEWNVRADSPFEEQAARLAGFEDALDTAGEAISKFDKIYDQRMQKIEAATVGLTEAVPTVAVSLEELFEQLATGGTQAQSRLLQITQTFEPLINNVQAQAKRMNVALDDLQDPFTLSAPELVDYVGRGDFDLESVLGFKPQVADQTIQTYEQLIAVLKRYSVESIRAREALAQFQKEAVANADRNGAARRAAFERDERATARHIQRLEKLNALETRISQSGAGGGTNLVGRGSVFNQLSSTVGGFVPGGYTAAAQLNRVTSLAETAKVALAAVNPVALAVVASIAAIGGAAIGLERLVSFGQVLQNQYGDLQRTFGDASDAINTMAESSDNLIRRGQALDILGSININKGSGAVLADLDKVAQLTQVVTQRSRETGEDAAQMMAQVVQALQSGNVAYLEQTGIVSNMDVVLANYAKSLGTTSDKLTQTQRAQAGLQAALDGFNADALKEKTSRVEEGFRGLLNTMRDLTGATLQWLGLQIVTNLDNIWSGLTGDTLADSISNSLGVVTAELNKWSKELVNGSEGAVNQLAYNQAAADSAEFQAALAARSQAYQELEAASANLQVTEGQLAAAMVVGNQAAIDFASQAVFLAQTQQIAAKTAAKLADETVRVGEAAILASLNIGSSTQATQGLGAAEADAAVQARILSETMNNLTVQLDRTVASANSAAFSIASRLAPALGLSGALSKATQFQGQITELRNTFDSINETRISQGQSALGFEVFQAASGALQDSWQAAASDINSSMRSVGDNAEKEAKRIEDALNGALENLASGVAKPSTEGLLSWDLGSLDGRLKEEGSSFADEFGLSFEDAMKKYGGTVDLITLLLGREDEVDEKARRLADVVVSGFASDYYEPLRAMGLIPDDVIAQGEGAVREFGARMLRAHQQGGFVQELYDTDLAVQKVIDSIQAKVNQNNWVAGVRDKVKEALGNDVSDADVLKALGISESTETQVQQLATTFTLSFDQIMQQMIAMGQTTADAIATPLQKLVDEPTAEASTKMDEKGVTVAEAFGEAVTTQMTAGNYGSRSVQTLLDQMDAMRSVVEEKGKSVGDWFGGALLSQFESKVPVGIVSLLATLVTPEVYRQVQEMAAR